MSGQDPHKDVIDMWKLESSPNFGYFDQYEQSVEIFWGEKGKFRELFETLDRTVLLEIACGKGRHTMLAPEPYDRIFAIDTSIDAIRAARERAKDNPKIEFYFSEDGYSIPEPDNRFTAAFSYDAMVHFEPITVAAYLKETARVLKPGARALFHHSVYAANPTGKFTESPHWRNYMTGELFAHFASRAGLRVLETHPFPWTGDVNTDALTLMLKPMESPT